jgi:hypothetical protein
MAHEAAPKEAFHSHSRGVGNWKLEHPKVCMGVHRLAEFYRERGKFKESESIVEAMLHRERTRAMNPSDVTIAGFLTDLGTIR